ncbi:hypothetical protein C8R43DRAFT_1122737 [Mycena crocata]|nr:hypothetical protein C8R43DRAFT_1122737 [Mycena crocata]
MSQPSRPYTGIRAAREQSSPLAQRGFGTRARMRLQRERQAAGENENQEIDPPRHFRVLLMVRSSPSPLCVFFYTGRRSSHFFRNYFLPGRRDSLTTGAQRVQHAQLILRRAALLMPAPALPAATTPAPAIPAAAPASVDPASDDDDETYGTPLWQTDDTHIPTDTESDDEHPATDGARQAREKPLTHDDLYVGPERPPVLKTKRNHQECSICFLVKSHPVS